MKNFVGLFTFLALVAGFRPDANAATSGYNLIVAPARYSVMQVAFDIVRRCPAVLVSYQGEGTTAEPLLHAWNGKEWVHISMQDFREISFVEKMPSRTILIGDQKTLPASLADAASWSPDIVRVSSLDTSSLVNEIGRTMEWSSSDWKWFAERYNLKLSDESEPQRHSSWYDQPGPLYRPPLGQAIKADAGSPSEPMPAPVSEGEVSPVEPAAGADAAQSSGTEVESAATP